MTTAPSGEPVRLRALVEKDLPFLDRLGSDPAAVGEFEWPGFTDPRSRRRRWEEDGLISEESAAVAVVGPEDAAMGIASWRPRGSRVGVTYEIGIAIMPGHSFLHGRYVGVLIYGLLRADLPTGGHDLHA